MQSYTTRRIIQDVLNAHLMTIHYWSKNSDDFPQPIAVIGRTFLYNPAEMYAWLNKHGKASAQQIREMKAQEVAK